MRRITAILLIFAISFQLNTISSFASDIDGTDLPTANEISEVEQNSQNTENVAPIGEVELVEKKVDLNLEKIAENNDAILYIDKTYALLRIESKKTKNYVDTKILNGQIGNDVSKNTQKSDLVFSYIDDIKKSSIKSVDTYSMSVNLDQVQYEPIENGIKISYHIGEDKMTLNDFPKYVEKQKMEDLVIKKLSSTQRKDFNEYYRLADDKYTRKKDEGVSALALKRLYNLMYEVGSYTKEDLEADNAAYNVELEEKLVKIDSSISYQLDGMDLVVTLPINEISISEKNPLVAINFLPYFLSSTQKDEGYMLVPDGSGAIINFNNKRYSEVNFSSKVYGDDILKNVSRYKQTKYQTTLPVFGIKWDDMAMLGIIEKGDTLAEIYAEISGKTDEFNKIGLNFNLREIERISAVNNPSITQAVFCNDVYNDDIVVRYKLIEGDQANYVGMAKEYQNYLVNKGDLSKHDINVDSPLFIELLGSIEKKKFFLGIPYNSNISLTTFSEAQQITNDIINSGITNLNLQYSGWVNGGMKATAASSLNIISQLGGKNEFNKLIAYLKSNEIGFYPNVDFLQAYSNKNLNTNKHISRLLNGDIANISLKSDAIDDSLMMNTNYNPVNLISPHYINEYVDKFLKSVNHLSLSGISSTDIGNLIVADYNRKRNVGIHNAKFKIEESINKLSQTYELTLSNPNYYAFKYSKYITDVPLTSNKYKVVDYDIPFVQLVLDGYIEYSSEPINQFNYKPLNEILLHSIETKSAPKFRIINESEEILKDTDYTNIMSAKYTKWKDKITSFYNEYNEFYKAVSGATVNTHEVLENGLRKITYSNGVTVYINYTDTNLTDGSETISSISYKIIKQKG